MLNAQQHLPKIQSFELVLLVRNLIHLSDQDAKNVKPKHEIGLVFEITGHLVHLGYFVHVVF